MSCCVFLISFNCDFAISLTISNTFQEYTFSTISKLFHYDKNATVLILHHICIECSLCTRRSTAILCTHVQQSVYIHELILHSHTHICIIHFICSKREYIYDPPHKYVRHKRKSTYKILFTILLYGNVVIYGQRGGQTGRHRLYDGHTLI